MNVKKNEFIIGLVMIIAAVMLVFGIFWLGNSNFFVKGLPINVKMENANGISKDDAVYFRGMKVGSVRDATITNDAVILNLKIEDVNKIPSDSKFVIRDLSFIGGKIIEIIPGTSADFLHKEDTVQAFSEQGVSDIMSEFKELKPKINKILDNADTLTGSAMFNELEATVRDLRMTIKDTKKFINGELTVTITSINRIAVENEEKISTLMASLNRNSSELSKFLNHSSSAALTLDSLLKGINSGNGSLGALVKNDSLYHNLNNAIISIDSLVSDIKRNPSKYIDVSVF